MLDFLAHLLLLFACKSIGVPTKVAKDSMYITYVRTATNIPFPSKTKLRMQKLALLSSSLSFIP